MKPDPNDIDDLVKQYLPSATRDDMESDGSRVLHELQTRSARATLSPMVEGRRWSWGARFSIAASLIVLAGLSVPFLKQLITPRNVYAIVEAVDGSLYRVTDGKTQSVTIGERINAGTPLHTEAGAGAVLKLPDGGLIQMHPNSRLSLQRVEDGVRIQLDDGSIDVTPAKQPTGNLYVQNQDGTVPVLAALFQTARTEPATAEDAEAFEDASIKRSSPPVAVGAGRGQAGRGAGGGPLTPCARISVQLDPRWFIATRASVYDLIAVAYGYRCPTPDVIVGGPVWIRSEMYDIQALIPAGTPTYTRLDLAEGNAPKLQKMLQHLLAKRFNLSLRRESKEFLGYNLTLVNSAKLKLSEDQTGATRAAQPASDEPIFFSGNSSLASYAALLQGQMGRPVDDKTGLKGLYDFAIPMPEINDPLPPGDVAHEASLRIMELLPRKLEQHLGLRLESTSTTVDSIVIEHVDKPTEN